MKIGLIGSGIVAQALGRGFVTLGHEVKIGTRHPAKEDLQAFLTKAGAKASSGSFTDAGRFGDIVVLATLWSGTENALKLAGAAALAGKIVVDVTNPLKMNPNGPPGLAVSGNDSAGEQVQRWLPQSKVVKAFNHMGNSLMFKPQFPGGPPDMFIAGNDPAAKHRVTDDILKPFGWNVSDLGGIEMSRYLEALAMVWIIYGFSTRSWTHAFKLLKQ
ncbi:MAG TPA: NAD(P)-binding domain-containing protein [Gemmatimonadales bacterium]|nr:NAD(P)-binding domain-containing protein [Gemmatimonadales bacterium]